MGINTELMRSLRKSRGWTQKQLAEAVGVSRGLISMVEVEIHKAYPSLTRRIEKALGLYEGGLDK